MREDQEEERRRVFSNTGEVGVEAGGGDKAQMPACLCPAHVACLTPGNHWEVCRLPMLPVRERRREREGRGWGQWCVACGMGA